MIRHLLCGCLVATFVIGVATADSLPPQVIQKAGTTASYAIGVQGVTSGVAVPVSGTVTAAPSTVSSASTPSTCSAVTSSATVLAANSSRKGFAVYAKSTNSKNARFAFATSATTSQEELLPGSRIDYDNTTYRGAVAAISDDGTTSITVCVREW